MKHISGKIVIYRYRRDLFGCS